MTLKINNLEIENIKRVKAVSLEPSHNGLTVIGGRNSQGKTSVLDAIAWALGGDKFKPSTPEREGSMVPPSLKITLNNGLIVERSGKNSSLKVIDPQGNKAGQQLLNEFVDQLALDLPKFMRSSSKEKADTLLQIIGVGEQLHTLETQETQTFSRRTEIGRIADQKKKFAAEMISYPEAPKEIISAADLIQQQQSILVRNGENVKKRQQLIEIGQNVAFLQAKVERLTEELKQANLLASTQQVKRRWQESLYVGLYCDQSPILRPTFRHSSKYPASKIIGCFTPKTGHTAASWVQHLRHGV